MEAAFVFVIVVAAGLIIVGRYQRAQHAHDAARAASTLRKIDATDPSTATDGERRAKRIAGRKRAPQVDLEVIGHDGRDEDAITYWAAYEMIVRGFQITLDMQEISQPSGGDGRYGLASLPTVVSRMTYTAEAFIPHLRDIDSLDTFGRYAPFRADRTIKLNVHPDDLTDAYALLRQLDIRLSVLHHPNQHWWKDEV